MHEMSLAMALVEQLEQVAKRENATRIVRIDLELGSMSGVEREPFEFAFPIVSEGTAAQDAILNFHEISLKVECKNCEAITTPEYQTVLCDKCQSTNIRVIEGRDFKVKSMEVE